jgi:membrane-bound lytic murein transglycosylase D
MARAALAADPFPNPASLRPAVEYWRQVFGVWGRDKVALHDDRHLGLVYEVIAVPGAVGESLTESQRDFVAQRKNRLKQSLVGLERSLRAKSRLAADQQALLVTITDGAGYAAWQGAAERVRSQRGMRERFKRGLEISGRYDALFRQEFRALGLPEDIAYLPHVESSFQPHARSGVGAVGMWQFMPSAARRYMHMNRAVDERLDPVAAARGAARYLSDAHAALGNWGLAITSYNHGVGGMKRARSEQGSDIGRIVRQYGGPLFGFASRNFYAEFLAVREVIANEARYFPEGVHYLPPLDHERITLTRATTSARLGAAYGLDLATLAELNPAWSYAGRTGRSPFPAGHEVWLPRGTLARSGTAGRAFAVARVLPKAAPGVARNRAPDGFYTVETEDTLYAIADAYDLTIAELRALNKLGAGENRLYPGQRLRVRAPESGAAKGGTAAQSANRAPVARQTHVVNKGDSLMAIARRYQVPMTRLLAMNELTWHATLKPGQRLLIPAQ